MSSANTQPGAALCVGLLAGPAQVRAVGVAPPCDAPGVRGWGARTCAGARLCPLVLAGLQRRVVSAWGRLLREAGHASGDEHRAGSLVLRRFCGLPGPSASKETFVNSAATLSVWYL